MWHAMEKVNVSAIKKIQNGVSSIPYKCQFSGRLGYEVWFS